MELALTVPQGWKRDYFVTVAYEWELLLDVFRRRVEPGFLAVVLGDHQPPFIADGQGGNDVAVHVVTDLAELPGPLAAAGFVAGGDVPWRPSTSPPEFRLEAVYPFLLGLLAVEAGGKLQFSPTGIAVRETPEW
ncbi:MAG: hypothetical protein OXH04_17900 [Acidobacteria bacterium]|nr:hypothetical protein [Acidobacteriota bacterium]